MRSPWASPADPRIVGEMPDEPAVPDEPHPRTGPETCTQCGSSEIVYDERIHDTFIYCQDCGAIQ